MTSANETVLHLVGYATVLQNMFAAAQILVGFKQRQLL